MFRVMSWLLSAAFCCATALSHAEQSNTSGVSKSNEPEAFRFAVDIDAPKSIAAMLEKGLDLVRWAAESRVTAPLLERLVAEARTATRGALAAEGYFSAQVATEIQQGEPVRVRITVISGPRTMIEDAELRITGPAVGTPAGSERLDVMKRGWLLKKGEPFRQAQWDAAKRKALTDLSSGRYAAARIVSSAARIDPKSQTARLEVEFDSGPEYRAGPLRVSGLSRYAALIVENMYPFTPGEPYDETKMQIFLRRLLESGYFASARTEIDTRAPPDAAPLDVVVIEARSQRIDTGVSFSTDNKLGAQLDYSNANVFDSAWRFRSRLRLDAKNQILDGNFDTPPQPDGSWNTYNAKMERTDIQNQLTRQVSVGVAHNWGLEATPSQLTLSAHIERKKIEASDSEDAHAVFFGYRKTFRHTDDLVAPRKGVLGSVQIGTSVPGLAKQDFLRGTARVTAFMPAGDRADLTLRAQAGIVAADARFGIPSTFLFRAGGDTTVRGYAFESIGVPQGNAVVGGRYLALGSIEYTRWFAGDWGGAVFIDAGDAFDDRKAFDLAVGYGIGARWRSPIGPFRADIAYGQRTHALRLHFSAGITF